MSHPNWTLNKLHCKHCQGHREMLLYHWTDTNTWSMHAGCTANPCWLKRQAVRVQTNGRNSPHPLICTSTAMQTHINTQTRNNNADDDDTSADFSFHAATFATWALIIQSGRRTDRPASPSVKLADTQNPEGSCCAGLVLSALQYTLPHHTWQH